MMMSHTLSHVHMFLKLKKKKHSHSQKLHLASLDLPCCVSTAWLYTSIGKHGELKTCYKLIFVLCSVD